MFGIQTRLLSLTLLTVAIAITGCGPIDEQELASVQSEQEVGSTESALCTDYCDNCVLFARCKAPNLPYGLTYWSDKVAVINSNHAHAGCVAMIPTSHVYGHAAYVADVDFAPTPNRITLREANWQPNTCSSRTGTKDGLNIRNFWCPGSAHTAGCSGPM
ncbi:MAG TPA: hypothetical protein VF794_07290 [Archangium sp.]|jgi:hypothetical protein|uniref:hypothetical protein n=1 Tax=Archangium sp. TaxID=1872627 RepID=UPI002EDB7CBE